MGVRRREQTKTRKGHVRMIVNSIAKRLRKAGDQPRMLTTDRVVPMGSLRRSCVRTLFEGWVLKLHGQGRVITKKLAYHVLVKLRQKFKMPIKTVEDHMEEIERLHGLLKASRKQRLGNKRAPAAMSSIDQLETLPMDDTMLSEDFQG